MNNIKSEILDVLQDLLEAEFKSFKWQLTNDVTPDIKPIPRGKLENADRHDVVDYMVQRYNSSDAGKIAVRALRKINQNDLAARLKEKLQEVPEKEDSSSSVVQSAPTPVVSVKINSSSGNVKAPTLTGGVFNGPVTFN